MWRTIIVSCQILRSATPSCAEQPGTEVSILILLENNQEFRAAEVFSPALSQRNSFSSTFFDRIELQSVSCFARHSTSLPCSSYLCLMGIAHLPRVKSSTMIMQKRLPPMAVGLNGPHTSKWQSCSTAVERDEAFLGKGSFVILALTQCLHQGNVLQDLREGKLVI